MQREGVVAHVELAGEVAAVRASAALGYGFTFERAIREMRGHAIADRIDHAADGLAAIAQGRSATHHFHAVGGEGIDGHAVVGTDVGDIEAADAILEHAHAVRVHAADDGTTGTGGEAGAGYAGHVAECIGQRVATRAQQLLAIDAACDGGEVIRIADGRSRDHDLLEILVVCCLLCEQRGLP